MMMRASPGAAALGSGRARSSSSSTNTSSLLDETKCGRTRGTRTPVVAFNARANGPLDDPCNVAAKVRACSSTTTGIDRRRRATRRPLFIALASGDATTSSGADADGDGDGATTATSGNGGGDSSSSSEEDEDGAEVVAGLRGILRDSQHHPPPARRSPAPGPEAAAEAAAGAGAASGGGGGGAPCDETVARLKDLTARERRREERGRLERDAAAAAAGDDGAAAGDGGAPAAAAAAAAPRPARPRPRSVLGGVPASASSAAASAISSTTITPAPTTPNGSSAAAAAAGGGGGDFSDANFPRDGDGRTLHLGTRPGEVAPRILSVGSMDRALALAALLAPPRPGGALFQHLSSRGFLTVTGRYAGRPVSVVTTLMGMPNMDFVARECRAVVDARRQMAVVRLGTCGGLREPVRLGDFCVAEGGARCLRRNPDAFFDEDEGGEGEEAGGEDSAPSPYHLSRLVPADPELSALLAQACAERTNGGVGSSSGGGGDALAARAAAAAVASPNGKGRHPSRHHPNHHGGSSHHHHHNGSKHPHASSPLPFDPLATLSDPSSFSNGGEFPPAAVHRGRNVTADGFYASQGRQGDGTFDDRNAGLVEEVLARDPLALSMEMETFHLLDLARCSRPMVGRGKGGGLSSASAVPLERRALRAAAVAITAAERYSNAFIGKRLLRRRELEGGLAALDALVRCELLGDDEDEHGVGAGQRAGSASVWSVAP